jgi:hypothetical protein
MSKCEPYELVVGHEALLEWFGYWPSFHDAEVLTMLFNRRHVLYPPGPRLEVRLHAFEMTKEVDNGGFYVLRKHVVATFEFDGLDELRFDGFNHQNAIFGLELSAKQDLREGEQLRVRFDPAFGVACSFTCRAAVLVRLEPGRPEG